LPIVWHYRVLIDPGTRMFNHLGLVTGFVMSSMVIEIQRYLPELQCFVLEQDLWVKFIKNEICSLSELEQMLWLTVVIWELEI
jgi:hypothetical protein